MSKVYDREEEEEEFTEMILNHDGFILGRKRKRDSSPSPSLPSLMMSEFTLNGRLLSIEIHETLMKDSDFYSSQIESGNDVFLPMASHRHMMDILLTFFQHLANSIRETREYLTEREIRWNKNFKNRAFREITLEKIYHELLLQTSHAKTYLRALPLKDLYDLIEVLNFFMSRSFPLTVQVFRDIADFNPGVVNRIENWLEERTSCVLHDMEAKFLEWTLTLSYDLPLNTIPAFPYRFTDAVWVMLKIEMFAYRLVTTLSGSFLTTGAIGFLRRLEPRTDFEKQIVTNQSRFVTKMEMIDEEGRLTEFNEFCLKYCKLTYSDGCTYKGGVYIHRIGGPLRHGYGTIYEAQDESSSDDEGIVIQNGKWLLNEFHCEMNVVCPCPLCNCDESEDEDSAESETEDYLKCCFHISRKEWNIYLDDEQEIPDYPYCTACSIALEPVKRRVDEEFLQMSNGQYGKTFIKNISSYKEYMDMFMPRN